MMLPRDAIPIRPITERRSLAPSSCTRRPIGAPYGLLSLAGRRRAYHVALLCLDGLGRISPPVVQHLRRVSSEHPNLTTCLLAQACQQLALGIITAFTDTSPGLTVPSNPGS